LTKKIHIEVFHALIALEMLSAYLYAISLFKPEYVTLSRGIIWSKVYTIDSIYVVPILLAVALAISLCVYAIGGFKAVKLAKVSVYILAILTIICGLSLAYWIAYIWSPQVSQDYSLTRFSELDAGLFHIYVPVYPLLLLTTLYAWLPLITAKAFKERVRLKVRCNIVTNANGGYDPPNNILTERLGLTFVLFLSITLPLIPYIPSINLSFKPVSVDIRYYSAWLSNMLETNCWSAIEYAFRGVDNGNRPLYLLMLYTLVSLGIPKQVVLNFEALLISPFFALTIHYVAKRLSGSHFYALLASLAAVLGFNMTVGMMAGFFAAWMALILFYICITLVPDLGRNWRVLTGSIITSITTLYIHPWTWGLLMAVLTAHLATSTLKSFKEGGLKLNKHLLTVLALNSIVDALKTTTSPKHGGVAESYTTLVVGVQSSWFNNLLNQPWNLHRLSISYVGGLFFNPLHIILTLIGILSLLKRRNELSKPILIWVIIISAVFPFSTIWLQSHLLFATPFPILIAEGLWASSRLLASFDSKLPKLFIIFFIVSSLTYTVRALCNLI
jgi:hypothetical protein